MVSNVGIGGALVGPGQVDVYPNPASDWLYIQAPQPVHVRICSIEGKTIRTVKNAVRISVADFSPGIYFIQISDPNGTPVKTEKWIKQ